MLRYTRSHGEGGGDPDENSRRPEQVDEELPLPILGVTVRLMGCLPLQQ